jgi:hypothetical protein
MNTNQKTPEDQAECDFNYGVMMGEHCIPFDELDEDQPETLANADCVRGYFNGFANAVNNGFTAGFPDLNFIASGTYDEQGDLDAAEIISATPSPTMTRKEIEDLFRRVGTEHLDLHEGEDHIELRLDEPFARISEKLFTGLSPKDKGIAFFSCAEELIKRPISIFMLLWMQWERRAMAPILAPTHREGQS